MEDDEWAKETEEKCICNMLNVIIIYKIIITIIIMYIIIITIIIMYIIIKN